MIVKVLFIGDQHIKLDNVEIFELFVKKLEEFLKNEKGIDFCVLGGDMMHYHEKIYTTCMNRAIDFVERVSALLPVYILIGNHDYINQTQFLSNNHWLTFFKRFENVTLIDKPSWVKLKGKGFVLLPYVYPGRFKEALDHDTINIWREADCIFCHQEFFGCEMNAIRSTSGDKWEENLPLVVSGHIHTKQWVGKNVYYPGTPIQHAFSEPGTNTISLITFNDGTNPGSPEDYEIQEIDFHLPRRSTIKSTISQIDNDVKDEDLGKDKVKISLTATQEEIKAFRKTEKYRELMNKGVTIDFKNKRETNETIEKIDLLEILKELVEKEKNEYLLQDFKDLMN